MENTKQVSVKSYGYYVKEKGVYVDTVGRNQKRIEEYIRNQLQEDVIADQLSLFEEYDPFTGEKNKRK